MASQEDRTPSSRHGGDTTSPQSMTGLELLSNNLAESVTTAISSAMDGFLSTLEARLPPRPTDEGGPSSAANPTSTPGSTSTTQSTPMSIAEGHSSPAVLGSKLDPFNHPDVDDPVAQALSKMIEPEDKINSHYQCARLTGLDSRDGSLLLGTTHFYVIEGITMLKNGEFLDIESAPVGSYEPVVPSHLHYSDEAGPVPIGCIKWPYDTIREVHKRRYLLRHCALEVFSSDGRNHFLIFHQSERDKIYQKLLSLAKSSLTENSGDFVAGTHPDTNPEHSRGIFSGLLAGEKPLPDKWADGDISNFQYLMHLNTLAGRSYNDLVQYPILPWVLADYESETLDLTNPKSFRDFSLPMGAQTQSRLARFIERYRSLEDPTGENTPPPYYYGTHYSSSMIVASYLIRMEPFTQHFLKLMGGHFDWPDRLFHSIRDAWTSASETNMADVKELIPEFFYLPEFLMNSNNLDLGVKQSGEKLDDVVLPPWAKGDAHEFIRINREALECDYVSAHLHEWIDLIFGYKQTGREALEAHNVFHYLFYEGAVDIDKIDDPVERNAVISFIDNFGQMPKQLFKKPHRPRKMLTAAVPPTVDTPPAQQMSLLDSRRVFYKNLVQLMPSREPLKGKNHSNMSPNVTFSVFGRSQPQKTGSPTHLKTDGIRISQWSLLSYLPQKWKESFLLPSLSTTSRLDCQHFD